jgi:flavin reductase (DIM6/NTAB) family NADH-FMN oxidoreductase RutF
MTVEREEFVQAMRSVANSVAVVTTDGEAGRHGATVTAFCSVSADPPSLLVCLRIESRIARAVTRNGEFCVNVLKHSASGLADRFAGRGNVASTDRFEGVDLVDMADGPPRLTEAACAFCCVLADTLATGSHVVAIGRVRDVYTAPEHPLAYLDGGYARVTPIPAVVSN